MEWFKAVVTWLVIFPLISTAHCSGDNIGSVWRGIDTGVIKTIYDQDNEAIYVSSVDYIYKLDAKNISQITAQIEWTSQPEVILACSSFQSEHKCRNHIKVLEQINSTRIFTCGTFSFNPTCCFIDVTTFTLMKETCGKSMWRFPYNPESQVQLAIDQGGQQVATATFGGFYGDDPLVSVTSKLQQLRSKESNDFLNRPHFAGIYIRPTTTDHGKVVKKAWVFFHEVGRERMPHHYGGSPFSDELQVTSRVASVCMNDKGGSTWILRKRLTSFAKMSLICSLRKGRYAVTYLHFTHIVETQLIENEEDENNPLVVALFKRGDYEGGSAICVYDFADIRGAFQTNRYWKPRSEDRDKLYETDHRAEKEECGDIKLSDDRLRFKQNHQVKVGFIQPKFSTPLYYDEENVFTSFTIKYDNLHRPFGYHLTLASNRGLVRQVLLHTSDLNKASRIPPRQSVLPDLDYKVLSADGVKGGDPFGVIKQPDKILISDSSGITQLNFPACGYHDNCSACSQDPFCVWKDEKCSTGEQSGIFSSCPEQPEAIIEPRVPQTLIDTEELTALRSRSKELKHELEMCRAQLKHMKRWTAGQLSAYKDQLSNQTRLVKICQNNLVSYSQNCAKAKADLYRKKQIMSGKLLTMQFSHKKEIEHVEEKAALACEKSLTTHQDGLDAVCDCHSNTIHYGYGWFDNQSDDSKFFISKNKYTYQDAMEYCRKMNAELPSINDGGFMKELVESLDENWKLWMGVTVTEKSIHSKDGSSKTKCLQLSRKYYWDMVDCLQPGLAVCKKVKSKLDGDNDLLNGLQNFHQTKNSQFRFRGN